MKNPYFAFVAPCGKSYTKRKQAVKHAKACLGCTPREFPQSK